MAPLAQDEGQHAEEAPSPAGVSPVPPNPVLSAAARHAGIVGAASVICPKAEAAARRDPVDGVEDDDGAEEEGQVVQQGAAQLLRDLGRLFGGVWVRPR